MNASKATGASPHGRTAAKGCRVAPARGKWESARLKCGRQTDPGSGGNALELDSFPGIVRSKNTTPVKTQTPINRARRSASASRSREAEQRRLHAMSVEERIKAALSMHRRYAWLKPAQGAR